LIVEPIVLYACTQWKGNAKHINLLNAILTLKRERLQVYFNSALSFPVVIGDFNIVLGKRWCSAAMTLIDSEAAFKQRC
jgi:hypothetical protein